MLLAVLAILIVYGSLYPFQFLPPTPGALTRLFSDWALLSSPGDMLGNAVLFVPWGAVGVWGFAAQGRTKAVAVTALGGLALSLGCQVAQVWTPSRIAAMVDVIWNMVGLCIGVALGHVAMHWWRRRSERHGTPVAPAVLLTAWLLTYWLPLAPSIDLQLLKTNFKAMFDAQAAAPADFATPLGLAVMCGYLLGRIFGPRASLLILPALLTLAATAKLFVYNAHITGADPLGFLLGTLLWLPVRRLGAARQTLFVALILITSYTVQALSPFEVRDSTGTFSWVPFAALLEGSMESNARALAETLVLFASLLYLVSASGGNPAIASAGLAVWVLVVEAMQLLISGRTADITQPLLVLALGQLLLVSSRSTVAPVVPGSDSSSVRRSSNEGPLPGKPPSTASFPDLGERMGGRSPSIERLTRQHGTASIQSLAWPLIALICVVALTTAVLGSMLRMPGIPYNVKELFIGNGHPLALAVFSLALLWAGAGSALLGLTLVRVQRPALWLPILVLTVSLASLLLLTMSVTSESIDDIVGSSNRYWFVVNKDIWGDNWRAFFLWLGNPDLVDFVERCIRYVALYAPLPVFLGAMIFVQHAYGGAGVRREGWAALSLFISAALLLWLCKAIAFDWSSTDNLNELIARDGDWGWGGGGYLYALLALICFNSLALAQLPHGRAAALLGSALLTAAAVPTGWWLLNLGLDPHVEKYDTVFSGIQFLLGANRTQLLSERELFVRWTVVQLGVTVICAAGIGFGKALLVRGHPLDGSEKTE